MEHCDKKGENMKALCFVNMLSLKNKALCESLRDSVNISCLEDKAFKARFYKCEIESASFVLALLCKLYKPLEFEALDEGYLSAESCFGEDEALEVLDFLKDCEALIFDEGLKKHKDYENIKYFLNFLSKEFGLELLDSKGVKCEFKDVILKELKELDNYDGLVLFNAPLKDKLLHASRQFLLVAKCQNEALVELEGKNLKIETKIVLDENLQGTIAFLNYENTNEDFVKIRLKELQ